MSDVREAEEVISIEWRVFLETTPPESPQKVLNAVSAPYSHNLSYIRTIPVSIQIHCDREECGGTRWFDHDRGEVSVEPDSWRFGIIVYQCRHCKASTKWFALALHLAQDKTTTLAVKIGEHPPFGPPTPSRVVSLIGPDKELFLKGRRAENQGLGIGAFAYYRRVVESQWSRIVLEVRRVAERLDADQDTLNNLEKVAKHTQFGRAVDDFKPALPSVLLIAGGQNPLTLLHSALSEAIHAHSDAECLDLAQDVRVVLSELADRISRALKDDAELQGAVNRLRSRTTAKKEAAAVTKEPGSQEGEDLISERQSEPRSRD